MQSLHPHPFILKQLGEAAVRDCGCAGLKPPARSSGLVSSVAHASKRTPRRLVIPPADSRLGQGVLQGLRCASARTQPDPRPAGGKSLSAEPRGLGDSVVPLLDFNATGLTPAPLKHPQCRESPCPSPGLRSARPLSARSVLFAVSLLLGGSGPLCQPGLEPGSARAVRVIGCLCQSHPNDYYCWCRTVCIAQKAPLSCPAPRLA